MTRRDPVCTNVGTPQPATRTKNHKSSENRVPVGWVTLSNQHGPYRVADRLEH